MERLNRTTPLPAKEMIAPAAQPPVAMTPSPVVDTLSSASTCCQPVTDAWVSFCAHVQRFFQWVLSFFYTSEVDPPKPPVEEVLPPTPMASAEEVQIVLALPAPAPVPVILLDTPEQIAQYNREFDRWLFTVRPTSQQISLVPPQGVSVEDHIQKVVEERMKSYSKQERDAVLRLLMHDVTPGGTQEQRKALEEECIREIECWAPIRRHQIRCGLIDPAQQPRRYTHTLASRSMVTMDDYSGLTEEVLWAMYYRAEVMHMHTVPNTHAYLLFLPRRHDEKVEFFVSFLTTNNGNSELHTEYYWECTNLVSIQSRAIATGNVFFQNCNAFGLSPFTQQGVHCLARIPGLGNCGDGEIEAFYAYLRNHVCVLQRGQDEFLLGIDFNTLLDMRTLSQVTPQERQYRLIARRLFPSNFIEPDLENAQRKLKDYAWAYTPDGRNYFFLTKALNGALNHMHAPRPFPFLHELDGQHNCAVDLIANDRANVLSNYYDRATLARTSTGMAVLRDGVSIREFKWSTLLARDPFVRRLIEGSPRWMPLRLPTPIWYGPPTYEYRFDPQLSRKYKHAALNFCYHAARGDLEALMPIPAPLAHLTWDFYFHPYEY